MATASAAEEGRTLIPLDITDAWHPTVNPSARMPVHHHRHRHVLGHRDGLLNEFPRRRGGITIRLPRIDSNCLRVVDLAAPDAGFAFAPWWLPASDLPSVRMISRIYDTALAHSETTARERTVLERLRDDFAERCAVGGPALTTGQALWQAADALHRQLLPSLPDLNLISLTHSPARHLLAVGLARTPGGVIAVLQRWAALDRTTMWPLLAVATSPQGIPLRVRLHTRSGHLDTAPLATGRGTKPTALSEEQLIELLDRGQLLPGARLTALAETVLLLTGTPVRHFGNTYGHHTAVADLLQAPDATTIPCCPDDEDSWHYADLPHETGRYPLHLIELAACTPDAHQAAEALVTESLRRRRPIPLSLEGDLDATVRSGGAGLLRQEDHHPNR
ncbi:hypothetical protein [Streptomyces sp. AK02-01A]|uniref:hypothetical protein n=1 Tax=Streptomyces sp. AK02-01A TaxID=3028648 RepID=UPI0029A56C18|nr:hypothetical protein [Streptomyces sp. AK02-01A]MDX3854216.1 hypothetical protein [Streptomyces sp. AK02-01A]